MAESAVLAVRFHGNSFVGKPGSQGFVFAVFVHWGCLFIVDKTTTLFSDAAILEKLFELFLVCVLLCLFHIFNTLSFFILFFFLCWSETVSLEGKQLFQE